MENTNTQRRAIGLLVVFATILTLIGIWNLPAIFARNRGSSGTSTGAVVGVAGDQCSGSDVTNLVPKGRLNLAQDASPGLIMQHD